MLHCSRIIMFSTLLLIVVNVAEILAKPGKQKRADEKDFWDYLYDELFGDSEESEESTESKDKKFLICSNCSVVVSQGAAVPGNSPQVNDRPNAITVPSLTATAPAATLLTNSQQLDPNSRPLSIPPGSSNIPQIQLPPTGLDLPTNPVANAPGAQGGSVNPPPQLNVAPPATFETSNQPPSTLPVITSPLNPPITNPTNPTTPSSTSPSTNTPSSTTSSSTTPSTTTPPSSTTTLPSSTTPPA